MKVPLSWLKEYVNIEGLTVEELADGLTSAGLEVAGVERIGIPGGERATHLVWDRDALRVGEILAVEAHPNADRLRLVTVAYGADAPKTVVTGAPNVRPGQRVAYATVGATVINGYSEGREHVTLEPKKLRGILSEGMVLSERELGLSDTHEGILDLPDDAPVGAPLQDYMGDAVIEIDLTANLGRAASIVGVAREVAAIFNRALQLPPLVIEGTGAPVSDAIRIEIREPRLNPRFTASLIRGVTVQPSPAWMQRRLKLAGMRPINNIVDITNYVMLEVGQPLHAFDYDALVARAQRSGAGTPTLIMRLARPDETLLTLDGVERALRLDDILVTDTAGILSLGGIMGGAETEVSDATTNVLLEAAAWNFIAIRRTSMRHLLFSEAAYRFSRGVHPAMASRGNTRAAALMADLSGGEVASGMVDEYPQPAELVVIHLEASDVNRLLGTRLTPDEMSTYLRRLEFKVAQQNGTMRVTVPDHREDVTIPADLVEEVARIHGLDNLPMTLLADALPPLRENRALSIEERVRDLLVGMSLTETIAYAMTAPERDAALLPHAEASTDISDEGYVSLANPISQERRVMRRNLLVSAMETLQTNLHQRSRVMVFEIGSAYLPVVGELLPREQPRLAITLTGPVEPATWLPFSSEEHDYWSVKGIVDELLRHLHLSDRATFEPSDHPTFQPGRAATLRLDGQPVGTLGELHPTVRRANSLPEQRIALADLDLGALVAAVPESYGVVPLPRHPAIIQDLAVIVDEAVPAGEVEYTIRAAGVEQLASVELFDVYRGSSIPAGKKSLAYTLRYLDPERNLTDEEVAGYHAAISNALRQHLAAQIRGEEL